MAEANGFGGFGTYHQCYSTTAFVFYNANINRAELFNLHLQHHNLPLLTHLNVSTFIPHPFTILSASWGFILCRDILNSYHIFDPLSDPLFGHTCLPDPPRPHANNTSAVISFDYNYPHYHAICAIDEGQGTYTFDTYSSNTRTWSHAQGLINLDGRNIIMNTGVSCNKWAYWLTDGPMPVVVRHDPESHLSMIVGGDVALNNMVGPETRRLQLGRVGDQLAIVVLRVDWFADLHVLMGGANWVHYASTRIMEGENDDRVQVEPLRFESYKMEVLFCVGHARKLLLWEHNDEFLMSRVVIVHGLENIWDDGANEADIANGVPYVLPVMHQHE